MVESNGVEQMQNVRKKGKLYIFLGSILLFLCEITIIYQNNPLPQNSGKSYISTLSLQPHSSPPYEQMVVFQQKH